jgi:hypothetical protein
MAWNKAVLFTRLDPTPLSSPRRRLLVLYAPSSFQLFFSYIFLFFPFLFWQERQSLANNAANRYKLLATRQRYFHKDKNVCIKDENKTSNQEK